MAKTKFRFNVKTMVNMHQGRERMDVFLTIILPLFLMFVSSYTNAWAFTGGRMAFLGPDAPNTYVAIFKGLFVEALVFCFFKLVKILCTLGRWNFVAAIVPLVVGLFGVVVSAGCGMAWAAKSGEMNFLISSVSTYLSPSLAGIFKSGLGMLFPVALAVLAVYDPKHMINEHVESGNRLGTLALIVENAEHHQDMLREAQKEANSDPKIKESYKQMAQINAQQAVDSARDGDYTFSLGKATVHLSEPQPVPQSSVQRIFGPVPQTAYPGSVPQLNAPQQPFVNSPGMPANFPSMGNTIPLQVPAPAPVPAQQPGIFSWLAGGN